METIKVTPVKIRKEVFDYWNTKKIVVHRSMNGDLSRELDKVIRGYGLEYTKEIIDLYATILEPGIPEEQKTYYWSYKWNLFEFLTRGVKKFDGMSAKDYLRKQKVSNEKAVLLKRK